MSHTWRLSTMPILLTFLIQVAGCRQPEPAPQEEYFETLVMETVARGFQASISDTTHVVLRTTEAWNEFAAKLTAIGKVGAPDFDQMFVLAAVVPVPSGGYSLAFDSVDLIHDEIVATYTLTEPGLDCMTIAALTQPFEAIAVPISVGTVRFERRTDRESCGM